MQSILCKNISLYTLIWKEFGYWVKVEMCSVQSSKLLSVLKEVLSWFMLGLTVTLPKETATLIMRMGDEVAQSIAEEECSQKLWQLLALPLCSSGFLRESRVSVETVRKEHGFVVWWRNWTPKYRLADFWDLPTAAATMLAVKGETVVRVYKRSRVIALFYSA